MNRNFTANKPDEKYVGDITFIRTWEAWLYLAIILDVFSRRIVGWAMGTTLHTELETAAERFSELDLGPQARDLGLTIQLMGDEYHGRNHSSRSDLSFSASRGGPLPDVA
jgi:transposase InsO family protein